MVTSGNWPMFSAEMLSWMLGARRFTSIAFSCDSRTPVMTMVSNVPALAVPGLGFPASVDAVVGATGGAGPCAPAFSAGAAVLSAAMAEAAAAASRAMDTAIEMGCLRLTLDRELTARL